MVEKAFIQTFLELDELKSEKERRKGFQGRKEIGEYEAKLFNFPEPSKQSIWMKDTHIPLDIIFLNEEGKVLNIEQGKPRSEEHIFSDNSNCKHVLELKQGKAGDFNISEGDNLSFLL